MNTFKLFFAITLFSFAPLNAQITKGNWMVGGTGNFDSYSVESRLKNSNTITNQTGNGFYLQPNIGYFVSNKFAVGLNPTLSIGKTNDDKTQTSYAIGVFTRYYLLKPEKLVNILTQIEYSYSPKQSNTTSNNIGFKAGPAIFFNESVALELTLNYKINNTESDFSSTKWKSFNIGIGFQIHLKK